MSFLTKLFKKKQTEEEPIYDQTYKWMTVDEALAYSRGELKASEDTVIRMTADVCAQIKSFLAMQKDTKMEYQAVCEYMSDIAIIYHLDSEERAKITDAARMIVNLDEERTRYQNSDKRIPAAQHRMFSMYEDNMPDIIKDMQEKEKYLELVQSDMRQIEGEKGVIKYAKEESSKRRLFLKQFSVAILITAIVVFIVLLLLTTYTKKDYTVPFFITGVAALAFIAYYFIEVGRCTVNVKNNEAKMNKATSLMNKVKLKYVNTTSALDYAYEKYHAANSYELEKAWGEYVKMKDEERRYAKNTQLINAYQNNLTDYLTEVGIKKVDSWVHQPEVFINRGEMVDYKDAIDRRRRKLRAQLDYNMRQQENSKKEIQNLCEKYPEYTDVILKTVEKCGV